MDSGRPLFSRRAQSSVVGIVLIIGLTLAAASAVVVFGSGAIDDGRQQSRIGQAEQAMTQFDSRAAQVALGQSDVQTIRIGQGSGNYRVEEGVGSVKVYHEDYNEYNDTETVFGPTDLGAVVYESEETTIAYQGGGVWRSDGGGGSVMVSPPEFHYRAATLTFPIIRVAGSGSASGSVSARVTSVERADQIFSNTSKKYDNSSRVYRNPIQNGNMTVEIQSRYCQGWRSYFEARTEGKVTDLCAENDTVRAQLTTLGTQGAFPIQRDNTVRLRGMEGNHTLSNLELRFVSGSNSEFKNFEWWVSGTDDDGNEIGISFEGGGKPCKQGPEPVTTTVYYNNASNDDYAAFVIDEGEDDAFETSCDDGEDVLVVDLLDHTRNATYTELDSNGPFDPEGSLHTTEVFDEHDDDGVGEPVSFTDGDETDLEMVVQHYFSLLGDADLETEERQQGNAGLSADSTGDITYSGDGRVVTFLHITDNELEVDLR